MKEKFKEILIEYFKTKGKARPSDLEDDLLGGGNIMASMMGNSHWHASPFYQPFGELVEEGTIVAVKDDDGWLYTLARAMGDSQATPNAETPNPVPPCPN